MVLLVLAVLEYAALCSRSSSQCSLGMVWKGFDGEAMRPYL
jgi:hypothetical protein